MDYDRALAHRSPTKNDTFSNLRHTQNESARYNHYIAAEGRNNLVS
jgi:hypothetical protein